MATPVSLQASGSTISPGDTDTRSAVTSCLPFFGALGMISMPPVLTGLLLGLLFYSSQTPAPRKPAVDNRHRFNGATARDETTLC